MDDHPLGKYRNLPPARVVAEFIALSVVESTFSPGLQLTVTISGAQASLIDTGRGMKIPPDEGDSIGHAERVLTSDYPIVSGDERINQMLTDLVWGTRGSLGPARANRSCRSLEYASRCGGVEWRQTFVSGKPSGPPVRFTTTERDGTVILVSTSGPIDVASIERLAAVLDGTIETIDIAVMANE